MKGAYHFDTIINCRKIFPEKKYLFANRTCIELYRIAKLFFQKGYNNCRIGYLHSFYRYWWNPPQHCVWILIKMEWKI